jgi:hypothetical protein
LVKEILWKSGNADTPGQFSSSGVPSTVITHKKELMSFTLIMITVLSMTLNDCAQLANVIFSLGFDGNPDTVTTYYIDNIGHYLPEKGENSSTFHQRYNP